MKPKNEEKSRRESIGTVLVFSMGEKGSEKEIDSAMCLPCMSCFLGRVFTKLKINPKNISQIMNKIVFLTMLPLTCR